MDPLFYTSSTNGLPSESKLATYMQNRKNLATPTYGLSLSSSFSKISLDSPLTIKKAQVTPQSPEFIPSHISSSASPSFYSPYNGVMSGSGGGGGVTPIKSNLSTPILSGTIASYSATSIKGRTLLRGDSPLSINDSPRLTPQSSPPPTTVATGIHQENVGGTTYFYPTSTHLSSHTSSVASDNQFGYQNHSQNNLPYSQSGHIYPGPASHVVNMQPRSQLSSAFFMPEEYRAELQARNEIANMVDTTNQHDLPIEVDNYHSLMPLESLPVHPKMSLQFSSYRATHGATGIKYCLRRLHGFILQSTKCMTAIEMWKKLKHSNIVQMKEVFTTKIFGDQSLVLIYDYHPGSQTLLSKYFTTTELNGYNDPFPPGEARPFSHKSSLQRASSGPLLLESEIWSIVMQLTAGLRAIHQAGLACRTLDPTKIIITGKRIRFSFVGIYDITMFDPNQSNPLAIVKLQQQEDLTSLGKLVLALACRNLHSVHRDQLQTSIELVARHYSSDLRNLVMYLLTPQTTNRCVTDLMPMIGARFYAQLDALQCQIDVQEDELSKEMENGRLYRLLVKLGCINEKPELNMDGKWSETGARYMLKLYRDYLFHSVTEDGRPWLDQAHIIQSLNKLDAGTMERVQLTSRDEQSTFIVTYAELKHCVEQSFGELLSNV